MVTPAVKHVFTVITTPFEVAVVGEAHNAFDVTIHVTV
jgi:hypothetical protein